MTMVIGPLELRSGCQSYSFAVSVAGVKSFGASISPGLDARCGCGVLPAPITTVPPFDVASKSSAEKSYSSRMQPFHMMDWFLATRASFCVTFSAFASAGYASRWKTSAFFQIKMSSRQVSYMAFVGTFGRLNLRCTRWAPICHREKRCAAFRREYVVRVGSLSLLWIVPTCRGERLTIWHQDGDPLGVDPLQAAGSAVST